MKKLMQKPARMVLDGDDAAGGYLEDARIYAATYLAIYERLVADGYSTTIAERAADVVAKQAAASGLKVRWLSRSA